MSAEYLNNKMFEETIEKFQHSKKEKTKWAMCIEDLEGSIKRGNKNFENKLKKVKDLYSSADNEYNDSKRQLAFNFLKLSENIVRYAKFNFIDEDDTIQEGVVICFEKIDRFDKSKGKAFNYLTTCVLNHFRQMYRSARNYTELKKKYQDFLENQTEKVLVRTKKQ